MPDVTSPTPNSLGTIQNVKNLIISNQLFQSTQEGLTAKAGGGQAGATPITSMCARFTTVATAGDSSILPNAMPGLEITVINAGAASMNVFPDVGSQVNVAGANVALALGNGKSAIFFTTTAGAWHTVPSVP
jgi:hypothetical protein